MTLDASKWNTVRQETRENNHQQNPHGYPILSYDQNNFWPYTHITQKDIPMVELRQTTSSALCIASRIQKVLPKI